MDSYEIEIKSLLGTQEVADTLVENMKKLDPGCVKISSSSQLNHYFEGGEVENLYAAVKDKLSSENKTKFEKIVAIGKNLSIRTREAGNKVILVIKASVDDTTSANGTARLECEAELSQMSLDEVDQLVLSAGYRYQAKWSRERTEYTLPAHDTTVCLDKNAGYGYLAEFERVITDKTLADAVKAELRMLMGTLGTHELMQDRLERMFAHYNQHWSEYYGTDKVFIIQ